LNKKKLLYFCAFFLVGGYFTFMHKAKSLPRAVSEEGISVIDEIQEVGIDGYKIFNPGVLDLKDRYLVVYRERAYNFSEYLFNGIFNSRYHKRKNILKIAELDQSFKEIKPGKQLLPRKDDFLKKVSDPRLFHHNGEIFLIFCDNSNPHQLKMRNTGTQMLCKLVKNDNSWEVKDLVELSFPGSFEFYEKKLVMKHTEKNWTPFSLGGKLYTVYLCEPENIILEIDEKSGICSLVSRSANTLMDKFSPLRGGTPPVFDEELGEFISIFHVAFPGTRRFTNIKGSVYLAGAYCFTKDKPFEITAKTKGPFYQKELYNTRKKIIFPTALIKKGENYLMFYGEDDRKIKVAKINRNKLLSQMKRK
jgi:predicted GH43/DUF377 family glycosyl hydrolase